MLIKPTLLCCALVLVLIPVVALAAKVDPEVDAFNARLNALRANSEIADVTRYEQLLAQQAVAALVDAKRKERDQWLYLADRRVEIAETTARAALLRRQLDQLAGTRSDLLIEESRREAARARHEAEQLRIQSQIQTEEAERARQTAEAEAIARQNAEQALSSVADKQQAKLSAAQQKAAQLAREEAELLAGAKLPPSRFEERIEVFTLGTDAYGSSKTRLSASAHAQIQALAQYLKIVKRGGVEIVGYGSDAAAGQKRAEILLDALVAAGISANRFKINSGNGKSGVKTKAAEVMVLP
ncbi:hypothetical protein FUT69_02310 [Xylella taiwanensis]|uniref:Membrane protein n=1 Tax=Xylella taiwanensis TaxID=1444770 RepID=Z9JM68_9GAMM|nr:membrane protein [Xylella taiwanensis]AXI84041.1 membrane protein [Xylella taiwanensis]EWS79038.1 membrane protein [Xylella taiwanensis]MCD8457155.1 hypothetical protein [Xylella taiwanensis]MCD8459563.1 hypothetical protein [Xylella taiwanensis]MCD8461569.1 hypothetical protein [Xylella taiwanensis]